MTNSQLIDPFCNSQVAAVMFVWMMIDVYFLPSVCIVVSTASKRKFGNSLFMVIASNEALLMNVHNICFYGEIRKHINTGKLSYIKRYKS